MKSRIIILAFLTFSIPLQALSQQYYSALQSKEDLLFYKSKLELHHPNLYLYSSPQKINHFFDSLYNSILAPLSEVEFYKLITLTSSVIKDGHTLILPSNNFTTYHNTNSKFLPFQIGISQGELYIKMNCASSKIIEDGTIIDSINGVPSNLIIESLLHRQVRDGENLSYSKWILDSYFREYYSYVFGHPDTFRISYKTSNHSFNIRTNALTKDSIYYYRRKNYLHFYADDHINKGIYLNYDESKRIALFTIKDFHDDVLRNEYKQDFGKEVQKIMNEVIRNQVPNLVIDLRNNQGGDVENGVFLLKYLLSKPFKVVNQYQKIKHRSLKKAKGPSMGYHKPRKQHYTGQVYVLLNGGSFSNSVIFSSCLRENSITIFIGTESGGNPHVLAGYAKEFELPNSKIKVHVPTKRFVMTSLAKNSGAGIIPTHKIENTIESIIHQNDEQIDFILSLIQQNAYKSK